MQSIYLTTDNTSQSESCGLPTIVDFVALTHSGDHLGAIRLITDIVRHNSNEALLNAVSNHNLQRAIDFAIDGALRFGSDSPTDRINITVSLAKMLMAPICVDKNLIFSQTIIYNISVFFIDGGYSQEAFLAIKILLTYEDVPSHQAYSPIILLSDGGHVDQDVINAAAKRALKNLRKNKIDAPALYMLCWYAYRKKAIRFIENLNIYYEMLLLKHPDALSLMRQYFVFRTGGGFFKDRIIDNKYYDDNVITYRYSDSGPEGITFLISCDEVYFKRAAKNLVEGLQSSDATFNLHINIVDPLDETLMCIRNLCNNNRNIGFSYCRTDDIDSRYKHGLDPMYRKTVYACSRFFVLPNILHYYKSTVVVIDSDQLVIGDLKEFISIMKAKFKHDIAYTFDENLLGPGRDPWIDMTVYSYRPAAVIFAELLRNYCLYFIKSRYPFWLLDQAGFLAVSEFMKSTGYNLKRLILNKGEVDIRKYFDHYGGAGLRL